MDSSNLYCKIFEYGIPLEDIFPPDDIHPRVKFLFALAYQATQTSECSIYEILSYGQGTLAERLTLKQQLASDNWCYIKLEEFPPGTYFWVIRQFLGLLPLPVLPKYMNDIILNWQDLADACQSPRLDNNEKEILDEIAIKTLSKLPPSNLLMLNMLITLIRKISRSNKAFVRRSLISLSRYFCEALFIRPFLPGYRKKNKMLSLFCFLIIRWKNIYEKAEVQNVANFLDWASLRSNKKNEVTSEFLLRKFSRDCSWVFNMPRIIPCILANNSVKETSSQTNEYESVSKNTIVSKSSQTESDNRNKSVEYNKICYLNNPCIYDTVKDKQEHELSKIDESHEEQSLTLYKTALNVTNTSESSTKADGFIYDDYETFKKEEFNQIFHPKHHSMTEKISKFGWTYTPLKKSPTDKFASTPKGEEQTSYVKFPDVFEEENGMSCDKQLGKIEWKSKKKLTVKSKISLDFIRRLMTKGSKSISNMNNSNIKYKRINRSNTL